MTSAASRQGNARWPSCLRSTALAVSVTGCGMAFLALCALTGSFLVPAAIYRFGAPAAEDIRTLTDGERTMTFISMAHVASPAFYDRVRERIRSEGSKGASYLYEGIRFDRNATGEQARREAAKIASMDGLMASVVEMGDLQAQPQLSFHGLTGRPDVWADMEYANLPAPPPTATTSPLHDPLTSFVSWTERILVAHARSHPDGPVRAMLRARERGALGGASSGDGGKPEGSPDSRLREARLKEAVDSTPGNVVITYGAAHYPGFRSLLGPGWREVSVERNPLFD